MRANATTGNESPVTTESGTVSESVESFVSAVTDALGETDADDEAVEAVREAGDELADDVAQLEAHVKENSDDVGEADERIEAVEETVANANHDRAQLRQDVHQLTETVEADNDGDADVSPDADPTGQTDETNVPDAVTPLGDVVTLPETVADTELTANVKRARDVAADVVDYGRSVPAGYAVTASELRTVLTALKDGDGKAYTQTVSRVVDHLEELGGEHVEVRETMGGERTVIFTDEFVRRTVAWRNQADNTVVPPQEAVRG